LLLFICPKRLDNSCQRMVRWPSLSTGIYTFILDFFRAILHDPEMFPDPEEFRPERFLDEDGNFQDDPKIALAFGAGKRICPGRHLVEAIMFIVASSILSVFNVTKAKDENGHEIPVKVATTVQSGLVT
jgi:cytochrome P450